MNDLKNTINAKTRRDFLLGASAAAGGAAFITTQLAADEPKSKSDAPATKSAPTDELAQSPKAEAARHRHRGFRASAPATTHLSQLGPLRNLIGTWVGKGFNLISLPDFDNPQGPQKFRLKLNSTREIIEFSPIGGNVPNRGSTGQDDIDIFGVTYLQRVSDSLSNGAMHIEPGLWLNVPATTVPNQPATVVRQGSIPHGTSILAQGNVIPTLKNTPPDIQPVDPTPFNSKGPLTDPIYLSPFDSATLPPGFLPPFLKNPNLALQEAILGQNIVEMDVLNISTKPSGGIVNIPFLVQNANVTQLDAIFWVETVQPSTGPPFMQLQYTQTVILNFLNLFWPHISVATLIKQ